MRPLHSRVDLDLAMRHLCHQQADLGYLCFNLVLLQQHRDAVIATVSSFVKHLEDGQVCKVSTECENT